jgi:hypothetical protein
MMGRAAGRGLESEVPQGPALAMTRPRIISIFFLRARLVCLRHRPTAALVPRALRHTRHQQRTATGRQFTLRG